MRGGFQEGYLGVTSSFLGILSSLLFRHLVESEMGGRRSRSDFFGCLSGFELGWLYVL